MMRRFGISSMVGTAVLALAAYAATAPAPEYQPVPAPGNHNETLDVGTGANKMTRTFIVHVPPKFDGKSKVPVVFMLHGAITIPSSRNEPDEIAAVCSSHEYTTSANDSTSPADNSVSR